MKVTSSTLYADIASQERFFSDKSIEQLKQTAVAHLGNFYELPFGRFWSMMQGEYGDLINKERPTLFQVYYLRAFKDFVEQFVKVMQNLNIPQTIDEINASEGLMKTDFCESTLVFLRNYFGLHSFKDAEQRTVGELLIAKRDTYNSEKYRRRYAAIQMKRARAK